MAQDRSGDDHLTAAWLRLPQPEFGQALKLLRRHCPVAGRDMPREVLAAQLAAVDTRAASVDGTTVWRWETGTSATPAYRRLLARACEVELIRMPEESRREFLEQLGALAGWPLVGTVAPTMLTLAGRVDDERLAFAQVNADRVDQQTLDDLTALTQLYVRQAQSMAPASMLGAVHDLM